MNKDIEFFDIEESLNTEFFDDVLDETIYEEEDEIVEKDIILFDHQEQFVYSDATYPALIGGFGCGKTEAGIIRTMDHMITYGKGYKEKHNKNYMFGVYEPTYNLIETVLYERFENIIESFGYKFKLNKSNNTIKIDKLGIIKFINMSNPSTIVGYQHGGCWIDELDTLPEDKAEEVWRKIIERNRLPTSNKENSIAVTTTPEGYRFMYKYWEKKKKDILKKKKITKKDREYLKSYVQIKGDTRSNKFLKNSYFKQLSMTYPADRLEDYMKGNFVNLEGNVVYDAFSRKLHLDKLDYTFENVHIGMDFNVGKMSAVISHIRNGKVYIVDEIKDVIDTPRMIDEILSRDIVGNIFIYPDRNGGNRSTSDASTSDIMLLKQAGFIVKARKVNPPIKDRVLSVNAMFVQNRITVNENNEGLIENLEHQVWNEKGEPDKSQNQDHMLDALGYLIYYLFPIKKNTFIQVDKPV